jgi:hypothetical protein
MREVECENTIEHKNIGSHMPPILNTLKDKNAREVLATHI